MASSIPERFQYDPMRHAYIDTRDGTVIPYNYFHSPYINTSTQQPIKAER
jgi:hypothetical protein